MAALVTKHFTASTQSDLEAQMNAFLATRSIGACADIQMRVLAVSTGPPKFYAMIVYQE